MKNMFLFALISATLFACTPIENEPNVCPPATDTTDVFDGGIATTDPGYSGYTYGFYYGKTYTVTIYQDGETPETESIVFVNDSVAVSEEITLASTWSIDGVLLEYGDEDFQFYYLNETDRLVCYKTDELTIAITK